MIIRRFGQEDAQFVADLINRNFFEENMRYYPKEELNTRIFDGEKVQMIAGYAHMYVICIDNEIIGCGAISGYWGGLEESVLLTIFVKPEFHKRGIGKLIIETLEKDELFSHAKKIEIPSSKTACEIYAKMSYGRKDGINN